MSSPLWWGDWRPTLTPHTGDLQPTDLIECTTMSGGIPTNTVITGQQIIDGAGGGGAAGYYAQYQDDITQPLGAVNVGQPVRFRTMDLSNGVTVNSDTEITIANTGVYNLQFSFQFQNLDTQEHDVTIWLRQNGVDVDGSAGFVAVVAKHGGIPGHCIPSWNYLLKAVGGDYYELYWSATSTQVTMEFYPAGSPPPSTASAIFTVTQQAGIIAGTGMTALNGLSADVQTISTGTTGTDFNVASSGSNHAFNLPTSSATTRGALSSTDWTTFNSKQNALVSGTNIKTIASTSLVGSGDVPLRTINGSGLVGSGNIVIASSPYTFIANQSGSYVTGTTANTINSSVQILANTISTENIIQIRTKVNKLVSTGTTTIRMYINTSNSLTGATLIATGASMASLGMQTFNRDFLLIGSLLYCYSPALATASDIAFAPVSTIAFNPAVIQYLIFAVQNGTTADSTAFLRANVMKYA